MLNFSTPRVGFNRENRPLLITEIKKIMYFLPVALLSPTINIFFFSREKYVFVITSFSADEPVTLYYSLL